MCTSIIHNGKKTIAGFNLDILGMEHRITPSDAGVYIEMNDAVEGYLPLFGANARGDFVGMPTCHPYDKRSDPTGERCSNIIILDIDLLLQKKTFDEVRTVAESGGECTKVGGRKFRCKRLLRGIKGRLTDRLPHCGVNGV